MTPTKSNKPIISDSEKIRRLETAVERLCDLIARLYPGGFNRQKHVEVELIKQYIRGDLDD